jgi:hypothetical protein
MQIAKSYINCTEDTSLPHHYPWHPRLSQKLGLFRLVQVPGSHELCFSNPKLLAQAIMDAVERSLYERANGYHYTAVKVFMPAGSKQPIVVHYAEHCPPDVGAAFIWLKNRDPERWRDAQNVEHVLGKYIISDRPMTVEQWAAERATVVNEVSDDSVTPELPMGIEQHKKGP